MGKVNSFDDPLNLPRPPSSRVPRRVSPNFVDTLFLFLSLAGEQDFSPRRRLPQGPEEKTIAKNKAARKEAREDALQKSDIGSLRAELKRLRLRKARTQR